VTARALRSTAAAGIAVAVLTSCSWGDEPVATPPPVATRSASPEPPDTPDVPDLRAASCRDVLAAAAGADDAMDAVLEDVTAAPEALEQVAANLRAALDDAAGDISAAAEELAAAIDGYADQIRSGDLLGIDLGALTPAVERLYEVCGR